MPRLLTFTFALTVFLCMLVAAVWVRGMWQYDSVSWSTSRSDFNIASGAGRLAFTHAVWPNSRVSLPLQYETWPRADHRPIWDEWDPGRSRRLGFEWSERVSQYGDDLNVWFFIPALQVITVPWWFLLCLAAASPSRSLIQALGRARRLRRGLCPKCGYDVRAATDRCPECGLIKAG